MQNQRSDPIQYIDLFTQNTEDADLSKILDEQPSIDLYKKIPEDAITTSPTLIKRIINLINKLPQPPNRIYSG